MEDKSKKQHVPSTEELKKAKKNRAEKLGSNEVIKK